MDGWGRLFYDRFPCMNKQMNMNVSITPDCILSSVYFVPLGSPIARKCWPNKWQHLSPPSHKHMDFPVISCRRFRILPQIRQTHWRCVWERTPAVIRYHLRSECCNIWTGPYYLNSLTFLLIVSAIHWLLLSSSHTHTHRAPYHSSVLLWARCQRTQMALVEDEVPVFAASEMWMPVSILSAIWSASLSVKDLLTQSRLSYRYTVLFMQNMYFSFSLTLNLNLKINDIYNTYRPNHWIVWVLHR